jgi:hypothetical protein
MSNITDEYLVLQCPNCGGKLTTQHTDLFIENDDGYIFIGTGLRDERLTCEFCDTTLQRRQEVQGYDTGSKYNIRISGNKNSAIVIGTGNSVVQNIRQSIK